MKELSSSLSGLWLVLEKLIAFRSDAGRLTDLVRLTEKKKKRNKSKQ